jgi:signal transduction histidine kinase
VRFRTWPIVANAFCALLVLVGVSVWEVLREVRVLDSRTAEVHLAYQKVDDALAELRTNVYQASLSVLELAPQAGPEEIAQLRRTLSESRTGTDSSLRSLTRLLVANQRGHVDRLRRELAEYWNSEDTEVALTVGNRNAAALPKMLADKAHQRESILEIAEQIDGLNTANVNRQEEEIEQRTREFQAFLRRTALLLGLLMVAIAGGSTYYLSRIEQEAVRQRDRAESAERGLRRLSNQLVNAQEEERKTISRELHDEVGQILTGLRMELGSMQSTNESGHQSAFQERLASVKALAEEALRSVRNLAMLLRPSMLDDLGLAAALRWQAKEFSRRTGIDTAVRINGPFDNLPDAHRTCLYRVIQEATTNIARHAQARHVVITLTGDGNLLSASVQDDGRGFKKNGVRTRGLGLVGMEERARELHGRVNIESEPGKGTVVKVELPLPEGTLAKTE